LKDIERKAFALETRPAAVENHGASLTDRTFGRSSTGGGRDARVGGHGVSSAPGMILWPLSDVPLH